MKKSFFYFFSSLIIISFICIFDFILSNTILNFKSCYKYEEYFYELKKNCNGKYRFKKTFPIVQTITDQMGLRIGKNSPKKNNVKKNIFLFGDSFTYGVGIEFEKTYAGLIEKKFSDYNVYNFAVGSYSPSVYLYKLKKTLNQKIFPEKIFLFLDLTDLIDEAIRWKYEESTNKVKLSSNILYVNSKKKEKFLKRNFKVLTNIFSYINHSARKIKEISNIKLGDKRKIKTSIQGSFTYTDQGNLDRGYWKNNAFSLGKKNLENSISKIKDIAKEKDIELYLVIYPWMETLEFGQKKFNWSNFAKEMCLNKQCKLIDTIPDFIEYRNKNKSWSTDLYFINDEHFNEKGAKVLFESLIKHLTNENKFKKL